MRRLASAGSRSVQGTSGCRATQQSQKCRAAPPPPPPPIAQSVPSRVGGSAAKGASLKIGVATDDLAGPLLSLRLSRVAGGLQQEAFSWSLWMVRSHPSYPTHFGGEGGWVDLSGHSWPGVGYTHSLELHRKVSSRWEAGCRFSCQLGNG